MNFPLFSPTRYSRFSRIPQAYRRQWFVLLHQVFHWRPGNTPLAAHTWTLRLRSLRASIPCTARVSPSILGRSGARRRLAWSPPASLIDNYVFTRSCTPSFNYRPSFILCRCTYHLELPTRWRSVINFLTTLPSAIKDISIQKILPRCYSVLAFCLRCRGLHDSSAVKATLKISDWHWHWHWPLWDVCNTTVRGLTGRNSVARQPAFP